MATEIPLTEQIQELQKQSRHRDNPTWRAAVEQLARLAPEQQQAWQAWRKLLLSENQELKLRGLVGLEVLAEAAPDLLEEVLLDQVESEDPVFLQEVARLAALLPGNAVFEALWESNVEARCAALPFILDSVWEAALVDSSEKVRLALALEFCEREFWPGLQQLASEDPSPSVRAAVASGISGLDTPEAVQILASLAQDSDEVVRAVAGEGEQQPAPSDNLLSQILASVRDSDDPFGSLEPWLERPDALHCLQLLSDFAPQPEVALAARLVANLLNEEEPALDRWLRGIGLLRHAPHGAPWEELRTGLRFSLTILECASWGEVLTAVEQQDSKRNRANLHFWPSLERLTEIVRQSGDLRATLRRFAVLHEGLPNAALLDRILAGPTVEHAAGLVSMEVAEE